MPNVFKFSESSSEKSLRKGNFSIGVGDVPKGPSSVTGFYQGVTPPIDGWMIYKKIDGDQVPFRIYSATQGSLVNIVNRIEGKTFSQIWECLNHYALTSSSVIVNKDFPSVVTDGLVLSLDASNVLSYPATGSSWYDLSGNGNNGTLENSPTFDSTNGGSIVFDGQDEYVDCGNVLDVGTSSYTVSFWVYINSSPTHFQTIFAKKGVAAANAGYAIYYNGSTKKLMWSNGNGTISQEYYTVNTIPLDSWINIVKIRDVDATTKGLFYINGQIYSITNNPTGLDVSNSVALTFHRSSNSSTYFFSGKTKLASFYNLALSAAEILQNYNATKDRFDIDTFIQRVNTDSGTFRLGAELDLSREFTRTKGASVSMIPVAGKASKLYSITPSGGEVDFTVSRNGTASYVDRDGLLKLAGPDVPRFDYNPVTKEFRGLLIEPSAQNLLLRSEEFDDAYWTKNNSTISANATAAPDGATTADKIVAASGTVNANVVRQNITITATAQTISVFLKQGEFTWSRVRIFDRRNSTGYSLFINLAAGELGAIPAGTTAAISIAANGFYRVQFSIPAVVGGTTECDVYIGSASSDGVTDVSGDGVKGIFAWGAQLETDTISTTYIPTVGSQVTRPADVISKTSVSSYIGQTEGTVYMEVDLRDLSTGSFRRLINVTDGTANNRLQINTTNINSRLQLLLLEGGVTQVSIVSPSAFSGIVKLAAAYAVNDIVFYVNGVQIGTDTSASIPACSQINLGANVDSSNFFNDHIRSAAIFPTRFTNTQLAELTKPS